MRKFGLFLALAAFGLAANVSDAAAKSCMDYAAGCMSNGGTKSACYGSAYKSCKRTCTYIGPYTGKPFSASGDCKQQ